MFFCRILIKPSKNSEISYFDLITGVLFTKRKNCISTDCKFISLIYKVSFYFLSVILNYHERIFWREELKCQAFFFSSQGVIKLNHKSVFYIETIFFFTPSVSVFCVCIFVFVLFFCVCIHLLIKIPHV